MLYQIIDQTEPSIRFASPAKLNLFLEIRDSRSDGFHNLESVMSKFSLYDYLTFTPDKSGDINLRVQSSNQSLASQIPADQSNLVVKTLLAIRSSICCSNGCNANEMGMSVVLEKNIPVQAGLGGASGNAAATLLAANRLWNLNLSVAKLMEIGSSLGSDIPYFLGSGFCKCTGKGDEIEELNYSNRFNILVAKPEFGLSTPEIYSRCKVPEHPIDIDGFVESLRSCRLSRIGANLFNRLETFAREINDGIERLSFEFSKTNCLGSMMTGSGSCYFGIYPSHSVMMSAASVLASRLPDVRFFAGHTIGNQPVKRNLD